MGPDQLRGVRQVTASSAEVPAAQREWQYKFKKFGIPAPQYVQWDGRLTFAVDRVLGMQSQRLQG